MKESTQERKQRLYAEARDTAIDAYGGACEKCGFHNPLALQFDHVFGDGAEERKKFKATTTAYYRKVLADRDMTQRRYQLLCANCNTIKWAITRELMKQI